MKKQNTNDHCFEIGLLVAGAALTVASIVVIPPLIKKYGDKRYKKSLSKEDIDYDNLGPEIIPNEASEELGVEEEEIIDTNETDETNESNEIANEERE